MIPKIVLIIVLMLATLQAEVQVSSKTEFIDNGRVVNLDNKKFVVVSLRVPGADGRYYFVDQDGTVVYSGSISSGAKGHETPEGIFKVTRKYKKYMSTKFPDPSGINNMNYSMFFHQGFALHQGNTRFMSHGCVHLNKWDAKTIFKYVNYNTPVIITKDKYMPVINTKEKQWIN